MKQKKRTIKRIGKALLYIGLFLCAFINCGTLLHYIPLIGDFASIAFLPTYPFLVIFSLAIAAICIRLFIKEKSKRNIAAFIISLLNVVVIVFLSIYTVCAVNARGEHINFFKAFVPASFSDVKEKDTVYVDQKEDNIPISIFYKDDGEKNKPVIFYTHGGGWITGSRYDRLGTTKSFADNGYVVVCADYDLSDDEDHLYNFTEQQLLNALHFCEQTVSEYGGDMAQLYMVGDSAGGNLALELAYKINSGIYTLPHKVKAVSVIYPVTDIKAFYATTNMLTSSTAKKMAVSYMGALPKEESERYELLNPTNYIGSKTPPTLIVHGTADSSVSLKSSIEFQQTLEQKGIESKLVRVPFANHGSDTNANNFLAQAYINNTLAWFAAN